MLASPIVKAIPTISARKDRPNSIASPQTRARAIPNMGVIKGATSMAPMTIAVLLLMSPKKENSESASSILVKIGAEELAMKNYPMSMASDEMLENIESICDFLEAHENNVLKYFQNDGLKSDRNPIQGVKTELGVS